MHNVEFRNNRKFTVFGDRKILTENFFRLKTTIESLQFLFFGRFFLRRCCFVTGNWTDTFSLFADVLFAYAMQRIQMDTHANTTQINDAIW